MKGLKLSLVIMAAALLTIGISGMAYAFHSGGVAECEGCHSMHNSFEGSPNVTGRTFAQGTGSYLLKANDQSGVCLNCHQSPDTAPTGYHVSTAGVNPGDGTTPVEMTPGGDFAWLKKTLTITIRKTTSTRDGQRYGHNIVAADFGYGADTGMAGNVAPGGTYPVGALACTSCHDPHGRWRRDASGTIGTPDGLASGSGIPTTATVSLPIRNSGSYHSSLDPIASIYAVGVYRILGGRNYQPKSLTGGNYTFSYDPPDAVVASSYNRVESTDQTGIAYGRGMSEWCSNCHTGMLQNSYTSGMAGLRHPAGNGAKLTAAIVANYNSYVRTGVMTNVTPNKAFSTLAPTELGSGDYTTAVTGLKAQATTGSGGNSNHAAADTTQNVACVTCHRAHASAFESSLRFYYLNEFMTIGDNAGVASYDSSTTENKINYGLTAAQQQTAYYDRPASTFGPYARLFCNKCHAKD